MSTQYLQIQHLDMNFMLGVHTSLWASSQQEVEQKVPIHALINDFQKVQREAGAPQLRILENNAAIFTQSLANDPAKDAPQLAYQTIVKYFYDQAAVFAISHAIVLSSTLPVEVVYRCFIDAMAMYVLFAKLDGLNPCPVPPTMLH